MTPDLPPLEFDLTESERSRCAQWACYLDRKRREANIPKAGMIRVFDADGNHRWLYQSDAGVDAFDPEAQCGWLP